MKKVIFCNTAYMRDYCGATNDTPVNGGRYIKENTDGGESYNFLDYNGKCYGYFMHYGKINIERIDNGASGKDYVEDVLVVWVAKNNGGNNVIVGWYKNATVYKYNKYDFTCSTFGFYPEADRALYYDIMADASDCFLLPENERNFHIPRASRVGAGMGMGQSAIWFADSEYAKKEFVPKVLEYIKNYETNNGKFINTVYTEEMLTKKYLGKKMTDDELIKLAQDENTSAIQALRYLNAVSDQTGTSMLRADILAELYRFDNALKYYEAAYEEFEEPEDKSYIMSRMFFMYMLTHQYDKAVVTGQLYEKEYLDAKNDEVKIDFYWCIINCFAMLGMVNEAEKYINKLRILGDDETADNFEEYFRNLQS